MEAAATERPPWQVPHRAFWTAVLAVVFPLAGGPLALFQAARYGNRREWAAMAVMLIIAVVITLFFVAMGIGGSTSGGLVDSP